MANWNRWLPAPRQVVMDCFSIPTCLGSVLPSTIPRPGALFWASGTGTAKQHLVRSIMEGVAFSIANCMDAIQALAHERGERECLRTGKSGGSQLPRGGRSSPTPWIMILEVADVDEARLPGSRTAGGCGCRPLRGSAVSHPANGSVTARTCPTRTGPRSIETQRSMFNQTYQALESFSTTAVRERPAR
jgi:hypothetical protein